MEQPISSSRARFTFAQYLEREEISPEKHEFRDGRIILMAGGTESHSLITTNVITALKNRVKSGHCRVYDSNLRVRIARSVLYSYPDTLVICGERMFDPDDPKRTTVTNPKLIIEVLSPSTELFDRGEKFTRYLQIDSLEEYVLIAQHKPKVETYFRQRDGNWTFAFVQGQESLVKIRSLEIELPMAEIFDDVEFPPDPDEQPAAT